MSRFLTPSRIALLALITVYSDGLVPFSATIPVLSFAVSYMLPVRLKPDQREDSTSFDESNISIKRLQEATITHASAIPGRTVWDLLLKNLWAINSLHALHAFFDDLRLLLGGPVGENVGEREALDSTPQKRMLLSTNSPMGAFVRRAQLEFTRLQFHDGTTLWRNFVIYRSSTLASWRRRSPAAGAKSFDSNLQQDPYDTDGRLAAFVYGDLSKSTLKGTNYSTDDVQRLVDHQINRMQREFA